MLPMPQSSQECPNKFKRSNHEVLRESAKKNKSYILDCQILMLKFMTTQSEKDWGIMACLKGLPGENLVFIKRKGGGHGLS